MTEKRRRKPRGKGKKYFTEVEEKAVADYNKITDIEEKNKLYTELIHPAFKKIVNNIGYTFRFNYLPNFDVIRLDCESHLYEVLPKYNPDRKFKAFSYFSVIAKNWMSNRAKQRNKMLTRETSLTPRENLHRKTETLEDLQETEVVHQDRDFEEETTLSDFIRDLRSEMIRLKTVVKTEDESRIIDALLFILENKDYYEYFDKNSVVAFISSLTNIDYRKIRYSIVKLRRRYSIFRERWLKKNDL